MNKFIKTKKMN